MNSTRNLIHYIESQKKHLGASSMELYAETNNSQYSFPNHIYIKQDITMVIKVDNKHVIAVYNKYCKSWIKFDYSKNHKNSKNFYLVGEFDDSVMFQFSLFHCDELIHP